MAVYLQVYINTDYESAKDYAISLEVLMGNKVKINVEEDSLDFKDIKSLF